MPVRCTRRPALAAIGLASMMMLPGCWVWIDSNPGNIDAVFAEAAAKVASIQAVPAAERGKPRKVKLIVYDAGDDQLVKVSLPLWLVRRIADHAAEAAEAAEEDARGEHAREEAEAFARHGLTFDKILEGGRGMLMQVDQDDERILVWLE